MSSAWGLQQAKNRFSEVVGLALSDGPQWVTRHGKEAVVVVSASEFRSLTRPETPLSEFFKKSPLRGVKLKLDRDRTFARPVDL